MKIIDENGRLLGKINIIDFLVLLFLLCLTPMFYYTHKIFIKKPLPAPEEHKIFTEIELRCRFIKVTPEISKIISVSDKEVDGHNKVLGEITWLGESYQSKYKFDLGNNEQLIIDDPSGKDIPAKIKLKAEIRGNTLYYKDYQLLLTTPIEFVTNKYSAKMLILSLEKEVKNITIDLPVILKDLDEEDVKLISAGDAELNEKKETISEIISIGRLDNNIYTINLGQGSFTIGENSSKKQLNVKMRISCQQIADQLYFKGKSLAELSVFSFTTDRYSVKGEISKNYETTSSYKIKITQVQVKFSGVNPELEKVIVEGDTEKKPEGAIMARITHIISNKASEVLVLKEDKWVTVNHPFNKDITATIELSCVEKEGLLYFKNYPVKIGNSITFTTDLYSISGSIIGLEIK